MKTKLFLFTPLIFFSTLFLVLLSGGKASAQKVGINTTGALPNASALLDVDAAPGNNKGLLIPRVPLTQISSNAPIGAGVATSLLVYNTSSVNDVTPGYYYWDGTQWVRLLNPTDAWLTLGNAGTTAGTNFVGTTDAKDLVFKTNNIEWMRILSGGNIGIKTATPLVSLQINATDAIAIPNGTTAQEPTGAPIGSIRFNTTTGVLEVFNGTCWQNADTPPIGATYVQWFNAADPNSIYPCTTWISSDIMNGEFIRATGGLSNVAAPPLTGVAQSFATQDHTHNSTGSVGNSATLSTSTDGSHNHGGATAGVSSANGNWFPYDDNLTSDSGNSGDFGGSSPSTCGTGWNGLPTAGNFMGQMNSSCMAHDHAINPDGLHFHTIPPHSHTLTLSVGLMSSGNIAAETRPTNVAVIFWRRTQ
jgi:hypothetical protein